MPIAETEQSKYNVLRALSTSDDTDLDHNNATIASQTASQYNSSAIELRPAANAAIITFHGTDANNETMNWYLWGYAGGGGAGEDVAAEYIAHGTATLGLQIVNKLTAGEYYADTISITGQKHLQPLKVFDSGNDRIAKLAFDLCGYKRLLCLMSKGTCASCGAKVRYI